MKRIVYALIGVLAVRAALGAGGRTAGKRGALEEIAQAPYGRLLLIAIGVGIAGYALWRFIQTAFDEVPYIPLWQPFVDIAMQQNVTGYTHWFHRQLDFRPMAKG